MNENLDVLYPPAPWILQGFAYQTVHLIQIEQIRSLIPNELKIVSILPNYTVGGIYLSAYGAGSALQYSELIVVAGLVNYADQIGAWISHIYVDNPSSVAGGRNIWGLPKELAQFAWQPDQQGCDVWQGDRSLYTFRSSWKLPLWRQAIAGQAFSTLDKRVLLFDSKASAHFALTGSEITVPSGSPFAHLNLSAPLLTVACNSLELLVNAPQPMN